MRIEVLENSDQLGLAAAKKSALVIQEAIEKQGYARIVLSTGASQLDTLKHLVEENVDWSKVEMFHLDEYINLPETHIASFRKYLKERFTSIVPLKASYFVNGEGDFEENIRYLSSEISKKPIDLGLIGIGENAHIAFNDPPADFETTDPYIVVDLDDVCKNQQVREGWFPSIEEVPPKAISMSVYQILKCKVIVSAVPSKNKAQAIKNLMDHDITNGVPATAFKKHNDVTLFLDKESASLL